MGKYASATQFVVAVMHVGPAAWQGFLDLLPVRASKGAAIEYLARKWGLALDHVLVAGDSGNDRDMLEGPALGVVVGNHAEELKSLAAQDTLYFASATHAGGILEGLRHYGFVGEA